MRSILDSYLKDCPAQYANENGKPMYKWENVTTKLSDIDTTKLHYVNFDSISSHLIVIDFDLKDENGNKSKELNIAAASKFPPTYAEFSKSGAGLHLHYIYDGDVTELSNIYDEDIEIKKYTGNSSLRRKLTSCNSIEIAHISSGLPLKEDVKRMLNTEIIENSNTLKRTILKCLKKEVHPDTTSNVHFIKDILDKAYESGNHYDVSDISPLVRDFALMSSHQSIHCYDVWKEMKFVSKDIEDKLAAESEAPIGIFDCEVFPNFWCLCAKKYHEEIWDVLINPRPAEVEAVVNKYRLIGYNNLKYDNNICYVAINGYNNEQIYNVSNKLINGTDEEKRMYSFKSSKSISYTDIYDFASKKQSLKKWEVQLHLTHKECKYDWDKPLPYDKWNEVVEYCKNDVRATEGLFDFKKIQADYIAREMLVKAAEASGCPACMNDTTNNLTEKIIFQGNKHPQDQFNYPDLSKIFPGYEFVDGKNMYRGINVSRGGYVFARPGYYGFAKTFDVRSMHPNSLIALNLFGDYYTGRFKSLVDVRAALKVDDLEFVKNALGGIFAGLIDNASEETIAGLAQALKIAINAVYGLTSATFGNAFNDISRNFNNIVALRGALFMKTLQDEVESMGYTVIHIKTDSIKVANPDERIEKFIFEFGKKYGYNFEVEDVFEKLILFDKANILEKLIDGTWQTVGSQYSEPYVKKTLFTHEELEFNDLIQTKGVKSPYKMYLNFNEKNPDIENLTFIGANGNFVPIREGYGGGDLVKSKPDGKLEFVQGSKGYKWQDAELARECPMDVIDMKYYDNLVEEAIKGIEKFVPFEELMNEKEIAA